MKNKTQFIPLLLLGLIAVLATVPALTAQEEQQAQQAQQVVIPEQVRAILQQGAQTRQPRLDIPFTFLDKDLYLPAQMNLHRVFFFKVKNADLGFAAPAQPAAKKEGVTPDEYLRLCVQYRKMNLHKRRQKQQTQTKPSLWQRIFGGNK